MCYCFFSSNWFNANIKGRESPDSCLTVSILSCCSCFTIFNHIWVPRSSSVFHPLSVWPWVPVHPQSFSVRFLQDRITSDSIVLSNSTVAFRPETSDTSLPSKQHAGQVRPMPLALHWLSHCLGWNWDNWRTSKECWLAGAQTPGAFINVAADAASLSSVLSHRGLSMKNRTWERGRVGR